MFLFPFLGLWLRFIFIYKLNWKKMSHAYDTNRKKENDKDVIAGIIGFVGIVVFFIIYQWLFD